MRVYILWLFQTAIHPIVFGDELEFWSQHGVFCSSFLLTLSPDILDKRRLNHYHHHHCPGMSILEQISHTVTNRDHRPSMPTKKNTATNIDPRPFNFWLNSPKNRKSLQFLGAQKLFPLFSSVRLKKAIDVGYLFRNGIGKRQWSHTATERNKKRRIQQIYPLCSVIKHANVARFEEKCIE